MMKVLSIFSFLLLMLTYAPTAVLGQDNYGTFTIRKSDTITDEPEELFEDVSGMMITYSGVENVEDKTIADSSYSSKRRDYILIDQQDKVYYFSTKIRKRKKITRKLSRGKIAYKTGRYLRMEGNKVVIVLDEENGEETTYNGTLLPGGQLQLEDLPDFRDEDDYVPSRIYMKAQEKIPFFIG